MPTDYQQLATELTRDLGLARAPIQITYLDAAPPGVPEHPGGAPSVCTFFSEGTRQPFYAGLPAHEACEIGAFVLGVEPKAELGQRLMGTVAMMHQEGYLRPGEETRIPRNPVPPRFVAYGPLGSLPVVPGTVLMFGSAKAAMLAMEAAPGPVPVNGRPMCAVVPTLNAGAPVAVSTGCIGSRTYTGLADGEMIIGVRGDHLAEFVRSLSKIRGANRVVGDDAARRKDAAALASWPG